MDFETAAKLGNFLSKDYAQDLFRLLVNYRDISASEAASRLNLHIRTAQEFFDAMASLGVLAKVEVCEKKRPYFRYSLTTDKIEVEIDLTSLFAREKPAGKLATKLREKKNAGAAFSTSRDHDSISAVTIWTGEGRERKDRRVSLTGPQGKFLYHLPFPTAEPLSISDIMRRAGIDKSQAAEVLDIVELLEKHKVIEVQEA
jgi:hypothetical protein